MEAELELLLHQALQHVVQVEMVDLEVEVVIFKVVVLLFLVEQETHPL